MAMVGLAVVLLAAVASLLWAALGAPPLTSSGAARPLTAAERLDALKICIAVVGGLGGVVALTVAYRKQRDNEAAERREQTRVFNDRFVAATSQFGDGSSATTQVAGAYALAGLADDWPDGRQMCIDVLCGHLRLPYQGDPDADDYSYERREVRRIILRIMRDHLREGHATVSWSEHRFSFERVVFDCGDLSKAHFKNTSVSFHRARFLAGTTELNGMVFENTSVYLTKAVFGGGRVDFTGTAFAGHRTSFAGAVFGGGSVTFVDVDLGETELVLDDAVWTGGAVDWGPVPALPLRPGA
ncbi:hypothetical protein [Cryptosporangium japonicum]